MKKNIVFFIIGFIVASSLTVYALSINSRDISYKNSNVSDAIDDLYEKVSNIGWENAKSIIIMGDSGRKTIILNEDGTSYFYPSMTRNNFCTELNSGKSDIVSACTPTPKTDFMGMVTVSKTGWYFVGYSDTGSGYISLTAGQTINTAFDYSSIIYLGETNPFVSGQ